MTYGWSDDYPTWMGQAPSKSLDHDLSTRCLVDEHDACTGKTNPEYVGGVGPCVCPCHRSGVQDHADGSEV